MEGWPFTFLLANSLPVRARSFAVLRNLGTVTTYRLVVSGTANGHIVTVQTEGSILKQSPTFDWIGRLTRPTTLALLIGDTVHGVPLINQVYLSQPSVLGKIHMLIMSKSQVTGFVN